MLSYSELQRILRTDYADKKGIRKGSRNEPIHIRYSPRLHVGVHKKHGPHIGIDDYHFYLDRVYKGKNAREGKTMPLPQQYRRLVKKVIRESLAKHGGGMQTSPPFLRKEAAAPSLPVAIANLYEAAIMRNANRILGAIAPALSKAQRADLVEAADKMARGALGAYIATALMSDSSSARLLSSGLGALSGLKGGFPLGLTQGALVGAISKWLNRPPAEPYRGPDIPQKAYAGPLHFF